jgi:signal transduction histidine kinase
VCDYRGRVPRLSRPSNLDIAIALVLAVWALVEAIALDGPGSTLSRCIWALAFTLPLMFRQQFPMGVAIALAAIVTIRVVTAQHGAREEGAMPFPAVLLATYTTAANAPQLWRAVAGGLAVYGALIVTLFINYFTGSAQPSDAAILSFFVFAAWGAGFLVRRRTYGARAQAKAAVAAERARISRELHDIIGHSVSVIALQAGAAEQLLKRDPDRAATHLETIQRTAREALGEMRRLMGVLREDEPSLSPQPGIARVPELVAQATEDGLTVELVESGTRPEISPGVDLAAYRVVQEALTNARKHAGPVAAEVRIAYEPAAVEVEVTNAAGSIGPDQNGGKQGLIGMRERVRLFGGSFDAGPRAEGGFRVRARFPTTAAES